MRSTTDPAARLKASERLLELAQQRRPLFELRRVFRRHTPRRERHGGSRTPESQKLSPGEVYDSAFFLHFDIELGKLFRNRFITAGSSQS